MQIIENFVRTKIEMIQSQSKIDISLAEAEQNYKNQMFKKNSSEIKHSNIKEFGEEFGGG